VRRSILRNMQCDAGILREVAQPGGGQAVERVEDMQSAPTASGDADEEPVSSVISAEEQQAQVTTLAALALDLCSLIEDSEHGH